MATFLDPCPGEAGCCPKKPFNAQLICGPTSGGMDFFGFVRLCDIAPNSITRDGGFVGPPARTLQYVNSLATVVGEPFLRLPLKNDGKGSYVNVASTEKDATGNYSIVVTGSVITFNDPQNLDATETLMSNDKLVIIYRLKGESNYWILGLREGFSFSAYNQEKTGDVASPNQITIAINATGTVQPEVLMAGLSSDTQTVRDAATATLIQTLFDCAGE